MIWECDNVSYCHDAKVIGEDANAQRVFCIQCKQQYVIKKDWRGVLDNREYARIFRKEILQPSDNLFYRYYPNYLRT